MTILVVNNYGQYNHRIYRALHYLKISSELVSNSLSTEQIIEKDPAGLVLGGGPSMERIGNCLKYVKELDYPILGICLGHQLIAKAYGGEVKAAGVESYAKIEINIEDEDDIFKGLGKSMNVWASHKDEVSKIPPEFKKLANSSICDIEAMAHKNKPIYGIQFHPEVHHTEDGSKIFKNFYEICETYRNKK
ncbi:MAG: GMP synthase subunit A [Methanobacteriaceae archaeon]|jgi:GMP synthase (glutamine-hydrolysing)|nr:MAG: GMP synthase [Methanobacterium sp. BRmetb2]MCC7558567.1 GMP synthase subunit A [Methanobacteriaceae archaeon]